MLSLNHASYIHYFFVEIEHAFHETNYCDNHFLGF